MHRIVFIFFLYLGTSTATPATEYQGSVVRVLDGDSLVVLISGEEVEIRLGEIDAPEHDQPYGDVSKQALEMLVTGKPLRITPQTIDDYGRLVARIHTDTEDVNATLVLHGAAWAYRRYLKDEKLLDYERQARESEKGIWALPENRRIPPWKWRAIHNTGEQSRAVHGEGRVIANKNTHVYHFPGCPSYDDVAWYNRVRFTTGAAAEAAGYHLAGNCPSPVMQ